MFCFPVGTCWQKINSRGHCSGAHRSGVSKRTCCRYVPLGGWTPYLLTREYVLWHVVGMGASHCDLCAGQCCSMCCGYTLNNRLKLSRAFALCSVSICLTHIDRFSKFRRTGKPTNWCDTAKRGAFTCCVSTMTTSQIEFHYGGQGAKCLMTFAMRIEALE